MQETQVQSLGWEDSPGVENGKTLQYSCLGNLMDRGAWQATVYGAAKVDTTEYAWAREHSVLLINLREELLYHRAHI